MPSNAAGRGRQAALVGTARGCGVRPLEGLAGRMNRAGCTHSPRASPPRRPESPFGRAAAAFLGMARPGPARGGRDGDAGSCPSFLPLFETEILSSWRRAGYALRSLRAPRRTWASDAATPAAGTVLLRRPPRVHLLPPCLGWGAAPRRLRAEDVVGGALGGIWAHSARPGAAARPPRAHAPIPAAGCAAPRPRAQFIGALRASPAAPLSRSPLR